MMAMKHLEERQEHEDGIHAKIPKYWERLVSGSQAILKFREEQAENLDDDMMEVLKTDLVASNTLLYFYALAPLESKIKNSTWEDSWNAMECLSKKNIEDSLKRMLRKPIEFEMAVNEESSSDEEIAPPEIPKCQEVVTWNMLGLAREDVIAAMVNERIAIFSASALQTAGALAIIQNMRKELGVVLIHKGEEEKKKVSAFRERLLDIVDTGAETSSQSTNLTDSDDDNIPLGQIAMRRKVAVPENPGKRKSGSTDTRPRKRTKLTSKKRTK